MYSYLIDGCLEGNYGTARGFYTECNGLNDCSSPFSRVFHYDRCYCYRAYTSEEIEKIDNSKCENHAYYCSQDSKMYHAKCQLLFGNCKEQAKQLCSKSNETENKELMKMCRSLKFTTSIMVHLKSVIGLPNQG